MSEEIQLLIDLNKKIERQHKELTALRAVAEAAEKYYNPDHWPIDARELGKALSAWREVKK